MDQLYKYKMLIKKALLDLPLFNRLYFQVPLMGLLRFGAIMRKNHFLNYRKCRWNSSTQMEAY